MRPRLVVTLTALTSLPAQIGNDDDDDDDGDPTAAAYPASQNPIMHSCCHSLHRHSAWRLGALEVILDHLDGASPS